MGRHLRDPRLALVVLLAAVLVPLIKPYTAQPAARYSFTAALWDDHSRMLDGYLMEVDRLEIDGHVYSDKAPGQPYLAVPFYAVYRAVGGDPARDVQIEGDLGLWWVTLWSSVLPALLLCWLMWGAVARSGLGHELFATGALSFGSLLLPFGGELYAHVLCAALLFGAWTLLSPTVDRRRPLAAGLLGGLAIVIEYPSALVLAPMGLALVCRRELGIAVRFVVGSLPGIAALLAYQRLAFGGAGEISYAQKSGSFDGIPKLDHLVAIFVGSRGMAIFTPVVVAGLFGLYCLARERSASSIDAQVGLGCFVALLWLQASWGNPWGGEMPGPRYLIPALPFLVLGVARFRARSSWLARRLLVVSVLAMSFPTLAGHLVPSGGATVVSHIRNIREGDVAETLFTIAVGPVGWVAYAMLVGAAAWNLRRAAQGHARTSVRKVVGADSL